MGRQKDEGHRGHAATDQRYGEKTRYHAVCRASPRERHHDPPEGRRCQRNGQEMSTTSHLSSPESPQGLDALAWFPPTARCLAGSAPSLSQLLLIIFKVLILHKLLDVHE